MEKLKKWLLPGIVVILGSIEIWIGIVDDLVREAGWPPYYASTFRVIAYLLTVMVTGELPQIKNFRRINRKKNRTNGPS